jgi:hypothetical protein
MALEVVLKLCNVVRWFVTIGVIKAPSGGTPRARRRRLPRARRSQQMLRFDL